MMRRVFLLFATAALVLSVTGSALAQKRPRSLEARQRRQAALAKRLERRFTALDKDHSGGLSRAEWPRAARAFDRVDLNKDGQLTLDELRKRIARHRRRARR